MKCNDCGGDGRKCLAGHSAHAANRYDFETCKGNGEVRIERGC